MNRAQRRALLKAERRSNAKPAPQKQWSVPMPCWAQAEESKRDQALKEAVALQSLLAHEGTDDDMDHWSSLLEIVLRICANYQEGEERADYLDPEAVHEAHKTFMRAAWGLHKAQQRHGETGVYGFDAADRKALIEAEAFVAAFRESVPRLVWARAIREALTAKKGVTITPPELEAA